MHNNTHYYWQYGVYDHPGVYLDILRCLPSSLKHITAITQNLLIHPWDFVIAKQTIPVHREHERHLRSMPEILSACQRIMPGDWRQPREPTQRLMVSCRSYALMIMAMLKTHGVPARCRYGFNSLLFNHFCHDQIFVEYWSTKHRRWCRCDPRTSVAKLEAKHMAWLNPLNMPACMLPLAAEVWQCCRRGRMPWSHFGSGLNKSRAGMRTVRDALHHDLAMLNQIETHLWDQWGWMHDPIIPDRLRIYDDLAQCLCDGNIHEWTTWYHRDGFCFPPPRHPRESAISFISCPVIPAEARFHSSPAPSSPRKRGPSEKALIHQR